MKSPRVDRQGVCVCHDCMTKGRFRKRTRRTFSREYKLAAVKKVIKQGLSYCEVARDLGIRDTLIHNWRKAFEADGTQEEIREGLPDTASAPPLSQSDNPSRTLSYRPGV